MAGLKLTTDNWANATSTVMKQQLAGQTVGVDLDGDWASYNSATAVWRLYGPSNHAAPPGLTQPTTVDAPHTFEPTMCGRYVVILFIETNSGDKKRFSAVYEVDAPQASQSLPTAQERDEYNNETGWSSSVEHYLRLHLKQLGARTIIAVQNVHAAAIAEGGICTIQDVRRHANSAASTDSATGNMENMMLTVVPINATVPASETAMLAYSLQPLAGTERGYAVLEGVIPFDTSTLGAAIGSFLYLSQNGELITKAAAIAQGNQLRPVARVLRVGSALVGADAAAAPGLIQFKSMPDWKSAMAVSVDFDGGALVDGYIPTYVAATDNVLWKSPANAVPQQSLAPAATTVDAVAVWNAVDGTQLKDSELYTDPTGGIFKLGIGVAAPTTPLDVNGEIKTTGLVRADGGFIVSNIGNTVKTLNITGNDSLKLQTLNDAHIELSPNGSGRVGVGTSSPVSKLEVAGGVTVTDGWPDIVLKSTTNSQEGRLLWQDAGAGAVGAIKMVPLDNAPMRFFTSGIAGGDEKLRIDAEGKVGIGTTAPTQKLHVNGSMAVKYRLLNASAAVSDDDYIIGVGHRAAQVQVTLPIAADNTGRMLIIKDEACVAAAAGTDIVLTCQGVEKLVDSVTTDVNYVMNQNGQSVNLYSNGTNWYIT